MNSPLVRVATLAVLAIAIAACTEATAPTHLAAQAARDRNLTSITFHPLLHYPVRMDLGGPPDASGSVFAAHLARSP